MKIAILIPSLNRPERIRPTAEAIHKNTVNEHRIYWCVSDEESLNTLHDQGDDSIWDDHVVEDRRYVTRMNKLAGFIDDDIDFIFFGSDDVIHHPGWDREALREFSDPKVQLVVVNDLRNPNGTQALVRREYLQLATYDAPGMPFHHGYQHNFADTEQFLTAHVRGVYARAMQSYVEHLHPLFDRPNSIGWDETYTNAQKTFAEDQDRFQSRAKQIINDLSSVP